MQITTSHTPYSTADVTEEKTFWFRRQLCLFSVRRGLRTTNREIRSISHVGIDTFQNTP